MPHSQHYLNALVIGIETFHRNGLVINRKKGSGNFVFIHFLTPVEIKINGKIRREPADTCIVYVPPKPQYYQNVVNQSFGNNWMHFSGRIAFSFLKDLGIPLNQPFYPASTSFVATQLRNINDEKIRSDEYCHIGMDLALRGFFLELARILKKSEGLAASGRVVELRELMLKLRSTMTEHCYEKWTLERMANYVHLSKSRFSVLYQKTFRVSPTADLLHMRVELAKYYLGMMQMPIESVAESCGFPSVYYFFRQFKKIAGITPGTFRRMYYGENRIHPSPEALKQP